jgi:hypothetical protein
VEEHSVTREQLPLAVTGTTGWNIQALPAGLVIDPATGVIDLGTSAAEYIHYHVQLWNGAMYRNCYFASNCIK